MADRKAPTVIYERLGWDDLAADHLMRDGTSREGVQSIAAEVAANKQALYGIFVEGNRVGSICYTAHEDVGGRVLFVTGMGADPTDGLSLIADAFNNFLPKQAKANFCSILRIWTQREGFLRVLRGAGCRTFYVMETDLGHE